MAEKLTLREPSEFAFKGKDGSDQTGWNFTTADGKRKLTCFDGKLVAAFTERKLAGVEHDYEIKEGGRGPLLVEIPGVYAKARGAGGWGGRPAGPSLTDRQAALFAAATVYAGTAAPSTAVLEAAKALHAWLEGKSSGQAAPGRTRPEAPARPDGTRPAPAGKVPKAPAPQAPASEETRAEIRRLAGEAGVELGPLVRSRGVTAPEELTNAIAADIVRELEEAIARS